MNVQQQRHADVSSVALSVCFLSICMDVFVYGLIAFNRACACPGVACGSDGGPAMLIGGGHRSCLLAGPKANTYITVGIRVL